MSDYCTPDELRSWIGSDTTNFADVVSSVCTVASREVDMLCGRQFFADTVATAQYFAPDDPWHVCVDDISTTDSLVVATDDQYNGTYSTTWTIDTDFILYPRNPITSITFPWNQITATTYRYFPVPRVGREETVKVTAKWGWGGGPPDVVKHATKLAASWLFAQKDAPGGYIGVNGWGPTFLKDNPTIIKLLQPYMRDPVVIV